MTSERPTDLRTWEAYSEKRIRDGQDQGAFDNLPGLGRPIPGLDQPHDEQWWIKDLLRREGLSVLPPSLEIRRDVERGLERIWTLLSEAAVRREVKTLNDNIRQANYRSVNGPPSTTMPLEEEEVVKQWRERRSQAEE